MPFISYLRPNGTIILNPEYEDSLDFIFKKIVLDDSITFSQLYDERSLLDSTKGFTRYQEFYKGIEVEDGGITIGYHDSPGGPGPCVTILQMIVPFVKTGIEINLTPTIAKQSLNTLLSVSTVNKADLVIVHNLKGQCEYELVWRALIEQDSLQLKYISAHSGDILKEVDLAARINATLHSTAYGTQNLNNRVVNGVSTLETADQKVRVFDFESSYPGGTNFDPSDWTDNKIPTTSESSWTNEAAPEVFQAFYTAEEIVKGFKQHLKIDFGKNIFVGSSSSIGTVRLQTSISNPNNLYVILSHIGIINQHATAALLDVVGHELAHAYVTNYIPLSNSPSASINEAICDMVGTYLEYKVTDYELDYRMGDDETWVGYYTNRHLGLPDPDFDCFTETINIDFPPHLRGLPLGYWYYLISTGNNDNIPGIGQNQAIKIVIDAIKVTPPDCDFPEFMEATFTIVEQQYGPCSIQYLSIARAWDFICVETGLPIVDNLVETCYFDVSGPASVCEESNYALFEIEDDNQETEYIFTLEGKKSTSFSSSCGMTGNSQYGCDFLWLNGFPTYPYYPQQVTILIRSTIAPPHFVVRKRLLINDCDHDDLTCEEYYNLDMQVNSNNEEQETDKDKLSRELYVSNSFGDGLNNQILTEIVYYSTFDLSGKRMYSGYYSSYVDMPNYQGVFFTMFFDKHYNLLKSVKNYRFD